jgi:hypothetical protein
VSNDKFSVLGQFSMTIKDKDGGIIDEYIDNNIVLTSGKNHILKALSVKDTNLYTVRTVRLGNDVGSGTLVEPEQPVATMSEDSQNVIYTTPDLSMNVTYPSLTKVTYNAIVDGASVMALFPEVPNIVYTSAAIVTHGGFAIAYKRFPARTISSIISVDISWTLEIL